MILLVPERRTTVLFMIVRDTGLPNGCLSASISKVLSIKDISGIQLDCYTWSLSTTWLTITNSADKNMKVPLANNAPLSYFTFMYSIKII